MGRHCHRRANAGGERRAKRASVLAVSSTAMLGWVFPGTTGGCTSLLDHLVRPEKELRRNRDPEGLGGLEIDDQLEPHGLLHGQVPRLRPPKDLVYEGRRAVVQVRVTHSVGDQSAGVDEFS